MENTIKKTVFLIFIGLLFLIFAQTRGDSQIAVSTLGIWIELPAGGSESGKVAVTNHHDERRRMQVEILDWERSESGKNVLLKPNTLSNSLVPHLTVSPQQFMLEPGQRKYIHYEVSMPPKARGSLWGAIAVYVANENQSNTISQKDEDGLKIKFTAKYGFAVKIWAIEPSTALSRGKVTSLEFVHKNISPQKQKSYLKLAFSNTGNIPLKPSGYINIFDSNEKKTTTLKVGSFSVLPGNKRELELPYSSELLSPGKYVASATLKYGNEQSESAQREITFSVSDSS